MKRFGWTIAAAAAVFASAAPAQFVSDAEPFVSAVRNGDGAKAMELLGRQPQVVNRHNDRGETALVVAISDRNDLWTNYLISKGADVNLATREGETPLIAASRIGLTEIAQLLLTRGAKVDGANRRGETPLIVAVNHRQLPMVKLLVASGADPDRRDSYAGYSAREYAARDTRSREILSVIETARATAKAANPASEKLEDFKLN